MKRKPTSLRMTEEGKRLLELLAEKLGISQAAVLELAIRDMAKKEEVK
jgi:hypothetical protein